MMDTDMEFEEYIREEKLNILRDEKQQIELMEDIIKDNAEITFCRTMCVFSIGMLSNMCALIAQNAAVGISGISCCAFACADYLYNKREDKKALDELSTMKNEIQIMANSVK